MHITPDLAGLIAQVYPTLLIVILIDGRMHGINHRSARLWMRTAYAVRYVALLGGVLSTWFCLQMFGSRNESEILDWLVTGTGYAMVFYLSSMTGYIMSRDDGDMGPLFGKRVDSKS